MDRKSKSLFTLAGLAFSSLTLAALLVGSQVQSDEGSAFCACADTVAFDHGLPLSHPINRCASQQSESVSWSSWFAGGSSSYQFHFIDLLELLSRNADSAANKTPTPAEQ